MTNFPALTTPGPLADGAMRIVPLGGLGEVGRNMTVFEFDGKLLIVDCGVLFPEENQPGVDLIETIADIFANYDDIYTEIIAASVRNPIHVTGCALAGANIATVPWGVLEQMTKHPLTDAGIEKFKVDYIKVFGE